MLEGGEGRQRGINAQVAVQLQPGQLGQLCMWQRVHGCMRILNCTTAAETLAWGAATSPPRHPDGVRRKTQQQKQCFE